MRVACAIKLKERDQLKLNKIIRGRKIPVRLVLRARIVIKASQCMTNKKIAADLGIDRRTVGCWRKRFIEKGLIGIEKDAPRGGRKATQRNKVVEKIIRMTTQTKPKNATHWSTRTVAKELGINHVMVYRVWQTHGLKPHLSKTFKVSNDPNFIEKLIDIVGLYLNPPEEAMVFCVDEKSQIQALDRTQPGLPIKKGRCSTMTHDYKRNGTTTLFAALEMTKGRLMGTCMPRHRHQEWIKFLKLIDKQTPSGLKLHLIVDNYATHKHPKVKSWIKRHPRFHLHFTPTSCSWLNLVERWFREITDKRIRRGVFLCVNELVDAIMNFIKEHNKHPRPFIWTAKAQEIIEKVRRARVSLDKYALA
jgi:transposase